MKKLFWLILIVVVLTAGLIFGGCPSPTATPTPTKVLKIGSIVPMTYGGMEGIENKKWMELLAKLYNDQGGWQIGGERYQVEVIVEDGGYQDAAKGRAAAEKLVLQDKVNFIVNNWADPVDQTLTITEPNHVITMGTGIFETLLSPDIHYFYNTGGLSWDSDGYAYGDAKMMMDRGARSIVTVNPDDEFGHYATGVVTEVRQVLGMTVLEPVFYAPDTVDYGPVATKIISEKPDCVDTSYSSGTNIVNIIGALYDAGYKGEIIAGNMDPTILVNLINRVGADYAEGLINDSGDPRGIQTDPRMLSIIDAYINEYGTFQPVACLWNSAWFVLEDAINNTQSIDTEVIKNYLDNSKHHVITPLGYTILLARPDLGNFRTIDGAPGVGIGVVKNSKIETVKYVTGQECYLITLKIDFATGAKKLDDYIAYWNEYGRPPFPTEPKSDLVNWSDIIPGG